MDIIVSMIRKGENEQLSIADLLLLLTLPLQLHHFDKLINTNLYY